MKQIKLTKGKYALVDNEDYEWLNQWKWSVNSNNYPSRYEKKEFITMHRFIMKPPKGMQVDHKDGDRLNNQKFNLRICTPSQNCSYRKASTIAKSGYRGVTKHNDKWRARIEINGKKKHLGLFSTAKEASIVYKKAAKVYFGDFSWET